jgi:hypothetical protein
VARPKREVGPRPVVSKVSRPKVVVPFPIKDQIGAGDLVKKVTTALGIRSCSGCEQRRRRMNRMLAFGRRRGR